MTVKAGSGRYEALDGLRGLAALLVVFHHMPWTTHFGALAPVRNGYLAVDLFFVLSGFVISAAYAGRLETSAQARTFLWRRFFRIYPLHLAVLAFMLALELVKLGLTGADGSAFTGSQSAFMLMLDLLLLQAVGLASGLGWNAPSWSIGAEWIAYLAFALVSGTVLRRRRMPAIPVMIAALLVYAALAAGRGTLDLTFDLGAVRALAGFTLGVCAHRLSRARPGVFSSAGGQVLALALLLAVFALAAGGWSALIAPCAMVVILSLAADRGPVARSLRTSPVQWLGKVSYSIYLLHFPLMLIALPVMKRVTAGVQTPGERIALHIDPWTGDMVGLLLVAALLGLSALTWRFIERPGQRLGQRLLRRMEPRLLAPA